MRKALMLLIVLLVVAGGAAAVYVYKGNSPDAKALQAGVDAYNKADYRKAYQAWLPLANNGNAEAQVNMAALYLSGNGVPQSFINSYMWIKVAQQQGAKDTETILNIAEKRLSQKNLKTAKNKVNKCLKLNAKNCSKL